MATPSSLLDTTSPSPEKLALDEGLRQACMTPGSILHVLM